MLDADVCAGQSAGESLLALVVGREIRTDHLPTLTVVSRLMNKLAADINLLMIVRRDRERKRPDEAIFHVRRRGAVNLIGPNFDAAHLPGAQIEFLDIATDTSRTSSTGPDDVRIERNRPDEAIFHVRRRGAVNLIGPNFDAADVK